MFNYTKIKIEYKNQTITKTVDSLFEFADFFFKNKDLDIRHKEQVIREIY